VLLVTANVCTLLQIQSPSYLLAMMYPFFAFNNPKYEIKSACFYAYTA
jgi:hypothetical protein